MVMNLILAVHEEHCGKNIEENCGCSSPSGSLSPPLPARIWNAYEGAWSETAAMRENEARAQQTFSSWPSKAILQSIHRYR